MLVALISKKLNKKNTLVVSNNKQVNKIVLQQNYCTQTNGAPLKWEDLVQPNGAVYFKSKQHPGYFAGFPGVSKLPIPDNAPKKDGIPVIDVMEITETTKVNDAIDELLKDTSKFALFSGSKAQYEQALRRIKSKVENTETPTKELPEQLHVARHWYHQEMKVHNRLLLAVSPKGNNVSVALRQNAFVLQEQAEKATKEAKEKWNGTWRSNELSGYMLGVQAAEEAVLHNYYRTNGLILPILSGKTQAKLFGGLNVLPPIHHNFLHLLDSTIDKLNLFENYSNAPLLDIGVGSGSISILLAKKLYEAGKLAKHINIIATDINPNAIEVTRVNATQILGTGRGAVIQPVIADVYPTGNYNKKVTFEEIKYGIIVAHPPYIPVRTVLTPLEAEIYDKDEHVLRKIFSGLDQKLAQGGKLILIYPNLAQELKLQVGKDPIETLASKYGFTIEHTYQGHPDKLSLKANDLTWRDPIYKYFKYDKTHVNLYVIGRAKK